MKKVIIIGGLHHNTLGVIRALGEHNVSKQDIILIIIGHRIQTTNFLASSKYVLNANVYHLEDDKLLFDTLMKKKKEWGEGCVVICCSDGASFQVISHNEQLSKHYRIPSSKVDIKLLMNKEKQTEIAAKYGLNIPKSGVLTNRIIGDWNTYPCITKPIMSIIGGGKSDIAISYTREELCRNLNETKSESVQIQEFIKKKLEYQLIGCSLNAGDIVIIPGYTNILRQPNNTNTGYLRYSPIDELNLDIDKVKNYVKYLGYSGLFSLEFLRAENGMDYYMEINMRNDGNAYCVTSAGVNLPYIWTYYNTNGKMPPNEPTIIKKSIFWIPDLTDLKIAIKEVGIVKWLIQMYQADSHSIWNRRDNKPFWINLAQKIHLLK